MQRRVVIKKKGESREEKGIQRKTMGALEEGEKREWERERE